MKAIIFGASGQDGYYLSEICKNRNIEPLCVSRNGNDMSASVADYGAVDRLICTHRPDYVFHMAANSTTRHDALFENHETISRGTLNILESIKQRKPDAKVFITGSGLQFKNFGQQISEKDDFDASSAYAVSRIHSAYAARYYRSHGINAYVGYLFHHESPLRKPNHISQVIVRLAKSVAAGNDEIIELGDITVQKEWSFAGDIAKGIFSLLDQASIFEATIGSGIAYSIKDWLDLCFEPIGRQWQNHIRVCEGYKAEYSRLVSDPSTMNALGWRPEVSIAELAQLMMR
jgi:GDPmannose 4,6-dehydratase